MTSLSEIYAAITSLVQATNNATTTIGNAQTAAASTSAQLQITTTAGSIASSNITGTIDSSQINTVGSSQVSNLGGWTLLQTILSSNAGAVGSSFALPTGYNTYMFLGYNLYPGSATTLVAIASTNGGTSYNNTTYGSVGLAQSSGATTLFNSTTTWAFTTNNITATNTNGGASFRALLFGCGTNAGVHATLSGDVVATSASTLAIGGTFSGTYLGGIPTAIRIQPGNGSSFQTAVGGAISLYGAL
jgi:hypothetical protein